MNIDDASFGIVGEEDDRRKRHSNRERPFEKIWLRGDRAVALEIVNRKLEIRLCAEVMAAQIFDEIIDADFVAHFENNFHMMLASGFAKFFWLDMR